MSTLQIAALALATAITLNAPAATGPATGGARPSAGPRTGVETSVPSDLSPTLRYTGRVVDLEGRPIARAVAESSQYVPGTSPTSELELNQRATTDTNGTFEMQLPRQSTALVVRKPGLAPAWRQWYPTRNTDERLVLTPPGFLAGIVVDEAGQPIAEAEVFVSVAWNESSDAEGRRAYQFLMGPPARRCFSTHTGADGRFRLEEFPTNGAANLLVRFPGKVLPEIKLDAFGPDTLPFRAGDRDIKLVLAPPGVVEGTIVTLERGLPLAGARLTLRPQGNSSRGAESALAEADGSFRFRDLDAGSYRLQPEITTNPVPDWVAESVTLEVEAGQTTREVQLRATKGGFLAARVVGGTERQPLSAANVNVYRPEYSASASTGSNGTAFVRLPVGRYRVTGWKSGWRWAAEPAWAEVQAGRTNQVEVELVPPNVIRGVVRDPTGAPVAGLPVRRFPGPGANGEEIKTDAHGEFEYEWNPPRSASPGGKVALLAQDKQRNLAVAEDLEENTTTLELRLEPSLTLAGRVEDAKGKPVSTAEVTIFLWTGNAGSLLTTLVTSNAQGNFEVSGLPAHRRYSANVSAKGYSTAGTGVQDPSPATNRLELPPLVLKTANRPLAGRVQDTQGKPVPYLYVHVSGEGQPNASARTDTQGHFAFEAVCDGPARLFASQPSSRASATVVAGDTNVVLTLSPLSGVRRAPVRSASLVSKPLPDLAPLGLAPGSVPSGKPLLLCLFDFEQRPSRRCLRLLAERHESLRQNGLAVAAVQAVPTAAEELKTWQQSQPIRFPVGCLTNKSEKTAWAARSETSSGSLPWLILTDAQRRVTAEGFPLEELDSRIKALRN